ncbi:hypothetical protein DWG18_13725 [Lysobacter sp. TY2-98]|uniref:DUF5985 family protein n=1 Tax=Lysobacter sp. TY2-98 TaxID=2290922 RepID=UPI000E1FC473|nr:DUF5985 family protein [Lysobacter sp. TY2-98]AXK73234.1 hypothetical protein DWG18_13725 [Lysobacter sp. TY2-98]
MSIAIYVLCALAALGCAVLLGLGARRVRSRMLVWSAICFGLLTLANIVLVLDFVVFPGPDVRLWPVRQGLSVLAIGALIYGLIMEDR